MQLSRWVGGDGEYDPRRRTEEDSQVFSSEAEAKLWRSDALGALHKGTLSTTRDTRRLGEALSVFVDGMKAGTVRPKRKERYRPATVRTYDQHVRIYLLPSRLGSMRVSEVRRKDIQNFADELLGAGLATGTVSNILNPIQAFFRLEVDRDRLSVNPALSIDIPWPEGSRPKRIASAAEASELLAVLPEGDRPVWATAFYAGLRRGELQALRCSDLDLGSSRISVEGSWDQYEGAGPPKSAAGRRSVPLLAILRDYLDQHLLRSGRTGDQLLFGRTTADPFVPSSVDGRAKAAWKDAELEGLTLHECRHTFASLLIDAGANPKAIQTFMGHSKIQTTFDTYGHLMPGSHDEVRERMDAYLSRDVLEEVPPAV